MELYLIYGRMVADLQNLLVHEVRHQFVVQLVTTTRAPALVQQLS